MSWMLSQEDDRISIASTDSNSSFFEPYFKVDRCETPSNEIQEIFKSNVVTTKVKMKSTPFDESPLNIMTESFESDSTLVAQMDGVIQMLSKCLLDKMKSNLVIHLLRKQLLPLKMLC